MIRIKHEKNTIFFYILKVINKNKNIFLNNEQLKIKAYKIC